MVLRIEDTDFERSTRESERAIRDDLGDLEAFMQAMARLLEPSG